MESELTEVSPLTALHGKLRVGKERAVRLDLRADREKIKPLDWSVFQIELAKLGAADVVALWEAKNYLQAREHPLTAEATGLLARALLACGATDIGREVADEFRASAKPAEAWLVKQLDEGVWRGGSEAEASAWRALHHGDIDAAITTLADDQFRQHPIVAMPLARLYISRGQFVEAGAVLSEAFAYGDQDNREVALLAALAYWCAADRVSARSLLASLTSHEHDAVSRLFARIETEEANAAMQPRVAPALPLDETGAISELLSVRFGSVVKVDSFAGVFAAAAEAELAPARVFVTPALLSTLSGRDDVILLLLEERPVGMGVVWVHGYEPAAEVLVCMRLGEVGSTLVQWSTQKERSALYGTRGIVVAKEAAILEQLDVKDDEEIELLDQCYLAKKSRVAFVRHTERLVQTYPMVPEAWLNHGEALLAQLRAEELGDDDNGPLQRWYAHVVKHFPNAEWTAQIYGQVLEERGLYHEAGIVWNEALQRDTLDYRNQLAVARLRRRTLISSTIYGAREALSLHPSSPEAWMIASQDALQDDKLDESDFCSAVAVSLKKSVDTLVNRGDILARRGHTLPSQSYYREAVAFGGEVDQATRRLCVSSYCQSDFAAAKGWAERLRNDSPHRSVGYVFGELAMRADETPDERFELGMYTAERFGFPAFMVDEFAAFLTDVWVGDELFARASAICDRLIDSQQEVAMIRAIGIRNSLTSLALCDHYASASNDPINLVWSKAQTMLLAHGVDPDDAALPSLCETLQDVVDRTDGFPLPRLFLAWKLRLLDAQKAHQIVVDTPGGPPSVRWLVQLEIERFLGNSEAARELSERLANASEQEIKAGLQCLRSFGLYEATTEMLRQRIEHCGPSQALSIESAVTLAHSGNMARAVAQLPNEPEVAAEVGESLFAYLALRGKRYDSAANVARRAIEELSRFPGNHVDPVPLLGVVIAADLARDVEVDLTLLGAHPRALACVAETTGDLQSLENIAPGLAARIEQGKFWWSK